MDQKAEAANFLAWLAEDVEVITAVPQTPRDTQLREFAAKGFLKFSSCVHGTNYYEITSHWMHGVD